MHYFIYGHAIAAVEDEAQAAKYAAAGWRPVSRAAFIAAWRARDMRDLARLWANVVPMTAVVSARKPGTIVERLSNGWAKYSV